MKYGSDDEEEDEEAGLNPYSESDKNGGVRNLLVISNRENGTMNSGDAEIASNHASTDAKDRGDAKTTVSSTSQLSSSQPPPPSPSVPPPPSSSSSPSLNNLQLDENNTAGQDIPWQLQVCHFLAQCSVDPDGTFHFYWKALLTLAVMYNCVSIILRIAFEELMNEPWFYMLDILSDAVFLLDLVVESKKCYLSNGSLITDVHLTLQNYMSKNILVLDIMSVVPTKLLICIISVLCNILGFPVVFLNNHFSAIEPTFRLNRLAKTHVMNSFFYKAESRTNSPNLLRALRLGIQLALVIHWTACLYYMISMYEGLGTTEWTYPSGPGYDDFKRKYIVCIYWSIMTLTTIGERPSPITNVEYIFTGLTFLIGVFVFAAVVGNVGDVISNMNAARRDFQTRMDQIKFYLNHRQVPEILQTRIKRWAEYTWDRTKAVDEPSVLQWLPERLRTEVAIYVHLAILKKVSIFDECEEGLLRELVLKLKPQIYSPGDYICRIGEIGREMYIINHGQVEILFPDAETGAMRQVAIMNPGNFFGEISLLKLDDGQNKRTADVRSIGFSELLCLSRRDLMVALTEYPDAKRVLEEYARKRFQQTKKNTPSEEASSNNSPRESVTTAPPMSARQVFARVMRREGFAKLLTRKDTDLMAIKSAVDDLKATNSADVHQTFISLHKEIQEMNTQLLQKDLQIQQAKAEIAFLKSVVMSQRLNANNSQNGAPANEFNNPNNETHPALSVYADIQKNGSVEVMPESQHLRNLFYSNNTDNSNNDFNSIPIPNDTDTLEQYYDLLLNNDSFDSDDNAVKNTNDNIDADSSLNSSDDDSDEDIEVIEEKFNRIGKEDYKTSSGIGALSKRSVSLDDIIDDICEQPNGLESTFKSLQKSLLDLSRVNDDSKHKDNVSKREGL